MEMWIVNIMWCELRDNEKRNLGERIAHKKRTLQRDLKTQIKLFFR